MQPARLDRERAVRVLMYCEQFHPRVGGAERQAHKLAKALLRRQCEVEVLTPLFDAASPPYEMHDGVPIRRFPLRNLVHGGRSLRGLGVPNTLYLGRQVRRAVRNEIARFDVIHAHTASLTSYFATKEAGAWGRPALCKLCSGGASGSDLETLRETSLLGSYLSSAFARNANCSFVAISRQIQRDLEQAGVDAERIVCIPNGVEVDAHARPRTKRPARRFLYLGRLTSSRWRDFRTLLVAFDALVREIGDCQLTLVGGGECEHEVRAWLDALPDARTRVAFVGFGDPVRWLTWADALVQPSLAEGMSNTLLEAMAAALPCIANDIPPNREVLDNGNAGVLVPVGDATTLQRELKRLALDADEVARLGAAGRQRALNVYAIDRVADRYVTVYRRIAAHQRAAWAA